AQFGSDLDAVTQRLLARGERLTELLKQPQFSPLPVEEEVVAIFAGVNGYLDKLQVAQIRRFEEELLRMFRATQARLLEEIRTKREISKDLSDALKKAIGDFAAKFA